MRERLISITSKDCRWDYFKGSGSGGQKKNKTSSACRCTHIASGAMGQSSDTRSQLKNKQTAFKRMFETKVFKTWLRIANAKAVGTFLDIDIVVDKKMLDVQIEARENNQWIPYV